MNSLLNMKLVRAYYNKQINLEIRKHLVVPFPEIKFELFGQDENTQVNVWYDDYTQASNDFDAIHKKWSELSDKGSKK